MQVGVAVEQQSKKLELRLKYMADVEQVSMAGRSHRVLVLLVHVEHVYKFGCWPSSQYMLYIPTPIMAT